MFCTGDSFALKRALLLNAADDIVARRATNFSVGDATGERTTAEVDMDDRRGDETVDIVEGVANFEKRRCNFPTVATDGDFSDAYSSCIWLAVGLVTVNGAAEIRGRMYRLAGVLGGDGLDCCCTKTGRMGDGRLKERNDSFWSALIETGECGR